MNTNPINFLLMWHLCGDMRCDVVAFFDDVLAWLLLTWQLIKH
ncbi:hypothetical protein HanXRQr2_Chr14g0634771 [Helianthus annuus]|uniref:Uncharacterized protein n=1 Tax=Helianthus annuus TaxID=4232 RepID=A0A9K3H5I3_HELAN|nr:hypothetical protein HanXRQr2_Chr14g0634771 [Helianthus annuus]KAJ0839601.1 hypothetical protein HanPSC8_Chr14g0608791 [Helianthus annuus]